MEGITSVLLMFAGRFVNNKSRVFWVLPSTRVGASTVWTKPWSVAISIMVLEHWEYLPLVRKTLLAQLISGRLKSPPSSTSGDFLSELMI